jgi:HAD superfamily hydrolase (TIGR01509 family)
MREGGGESTVTAKMAASAVTSRPRRTAEGAIDRRARVGTAPVKSETIEVAAKPAPAPTLELETIASRWQRALDAAERAVNAAGAASLPARDVDLRRSALRQERQETADALARLAGVAGIRPVPWLSPVPVTSEMLSLAAGTRACLFDLDGVLTDSAVLHAWAWGEVFDEFLLRLTERAGWHFIPFDRDADYHAYIDGRPRLEGIHAFLESRGIRVPEGRSSDAPDADTARGLARRKGDTLARGLRKRGVTTLPGGRRYLEAAGRAGLERGVVSASASTSHMLELAGLRTLVEDQVDADVIRVEGLRSRPAPDLLLAACRHLDVRPGEAVTFTTSAAGIAAGHAAGLAVVGVAEGAHAELLRGFGAERVVPSLSVLLDRRLSDSRRDGRGIRA